MSFETGTQTELLFSGPPSSYTAGGSSSTSVFALTAGATGNYQQPVLRGLLLQQGRNNQVFSAEGWIVLSAESSTTTFQLTVALATSANQTTGSTLLQFPAITVTSYSTGSIWFKTTTFNKGSGYGTSSVATSLQTHGQLTAVGATSTYSVITNTLLQTVDFSVNQWLTVLGQFSTSSGTNSAQLLDVILRGEN
jgi:hypothetical protein